MLKAFGNAFLQGIAYALAFAAIFLLYSMVMMFFVGSSSTQSDARRNALVERQWQDYEARLKTQDEHAQKAEAALDRASHYYDRMEANAGKQEEINRRLEAVISRWESQKVVPALRP